MMREKFLTKKWLIIVMVVIAIGMCAGGYFYFKNKNETASVNQETLVPVVRQDLREVIEVSGMISSANYTSVQTQAIGTVREVLVRDGETVKVGDELFELELSPEGKENNQAAYSAYLSARNNLSSAQNRLNSLQVTLFETNQYLIDHGVKENLDKNTPEYIMQDASWLAAEGDYKNQQQVIAQSQAAVNSAYQNYRNTSATIAAPVSGVVENVTAVVGMAFGSAASGAGVSLSERLATIKTGEEILAFFDLAASDIVQVEIGQPVTLSGSNLPQDFTGEVVSVDRYGTTGTTTTYQVIAQFDPESSNAAALLPNLTVDGEILVGSTPNALVVPTLAISSDRSQASVTVKDSEGMASVKQITTGIVSGNLTEVTSGLSEGEQVVLSLPEFSSATQNMMRGGGMMMVGGPGAAAGGAGARQTGRTPGGGG